MCTDYEQKTNPGHNLYTSLPGQNLCTGPNAAIPRVGASVSQTLKPLVRVSVKLKPLVRDSLKLKPMVRVSLKTFLRDLERVSVNEIYHTI